MFLTTRLIYNVIRKKVFSSNEAVMIAHYKGLNVKELDKIRSEMRESGIFFKVTKVSSVEPSSTTTIS